MTIWASIFCESTFRHGLTTGMEEVWDKETCGSQSFNSPYHCQYQYGMILHVITPKLAYDGGVLQLCQTFRCNLMLITSQGSQYVANRSTVVPIQSMCHIHHMFEPVAFSSICCITPTVSFVQALSDGACFDERCMNSTSFVFLYTARGSLEVVHRCLSWYSGSAYV